MIFISYSRKDKEFVVPLVKFLRASGQNVFFDKDNIEYGSNWKTALENAINNSKRFLLFWSKSTQDSEIVKTEIEIAVSNSSIIMVPIILDKSPLPNGVSDYNGSDDLIQMFNEIIIQKRRNKRLIRVFISFILLIVLVSTLYLTYNVPLPRVFAPPPIGIEESPNEPLNDYFDTRYILYACLLSLPIIWFLIKYLRKRIEIRKKYKLVTAYLLK